MSRLARVRTGDHRLSMTGSRTRTVQFITGRGGALARVSELIGDGVGVPVFAASIGFGSMPGVVGEE